MDTLKSLLDISGGDRGGGDVGDVSYDGDGGYGGYGDVVDCLFQYYPVLSV